MANNAVRWIAPVLLGALMLLFPADGLRALGLGEARVDSWLGQPLDISIRLLDVESEAVESVSVAPASLEDYERLGVPSDSLGLGLEVTVDRSTDPATVRVRSKQPVDDPVVQILIDARWSSGRVLREYTLFLDPPVRDSAAPVRDVSQPAAESASEPASETEPAPAERQEREAAQRADEPATQPSSRPSQPADDSAATAPRAGDTVRVSRGDTLWRIAQDWRSDRSLSMDQVMLAIFNRNRGAFLGENINRLRSDALLDMPGTDEVRAVDRAEAEQRVREHMRSWQPQVAEDVPVVSDAATPETPEPPAEADQEAVAQEEQGAAQEEEAGPEDGAAETAESEEDYRLDVVPPEDDQYSETSAVSESEVQRVSQQLAEVEEEIAASGVENERFEEHVAEVRDALDQRDMAGVAVAEESLAELEDRLREARETRAEQDELAQADDGGESTDGDAGDEVTEYMSELEEEFGVEDGEEAASESEEMAAVDEAGTGEAGESDGGDTRTEDESEAMAAADDSAGDESGQAEEAEDSMPVTRSSDGTSGWLWPAVGLLVLVIVVVAALLWLRRRREGSETGEVASTAGDAVASARASVARKPGDLAAHLALLKLLADRGREQEFTDAFDQMYQHVEDESAPEWQEALSLASAHVPDHPLLTPHEAPEEDDFDRRADEMLGMLDMDESDAESEDAADTQQREFGDTGDEAFDLGLEEETREPAPSGTEGDAGEADQEETFDEDMDLAVLSDRLDDQNSDAGSVTSVPQDTGETDFGTFEESDEEAASTEEAADEHSEAPVDLEDEKATGPDLDFTPAREQEAEEVLGEAGAREDEDLDLELSSDVEDFDSTAPDEGLDFDLGESDETGAETSEPEEVPGAGESADSAEEESTEQAGGSLSDEDADVKLDLARAYISVDLADSARPVLEEVISDGSESKREEARKLLDDLD
ncbi:MULTISPECIES: FimV/HubP family polar landmark protein [unclassified Wenzhouxiangella]|uniref:FimV/HubP family polar landmark protein n=1 Tax=unclassified Wenzhouxiangella TaxID=2613841 RepID=UPI000E327B3B|nr:MULTISPECIES: FimV/HubP family polar landmark protein [unclassified Wenzhouxiangella]RFF27625.1 hypothetical protein DZK25_07105 [Wenzhouxiangella sp. 15181]RFP70149.1 hypothetical protein DZK26_01110 [Wenzhouxiangella sp. 15190]